jgi:hypothetical protein
MINDSPRYLLATYVDGPYGASALELLLYPVGCSFYRPFSYRREYAGSSVSETPPDSTTLPWGFIGARFKDEQGKGTRGLFIPLRRIDEIHIRDSDGFHVQFRLGEFIQHTDPHGFLTFDLNAKLGDEFAKKNDLLITTLSAQFGAELVRLPTLKNPPTDMWNRFIDDPNLRHEARSRLLNASLLQLTKIRERSSGSELEPAKLETLGPGFHERHGYHFRAGQVYDLELVHRTLIDKGGTSKLRSISYEFSGPLDRFRISRPRIPQTGNYREERLWIVPTTTEPAPVLLEWEPVDENPEVPARKPAERAVSLRIPISVSLQPWYRFRTARLVVGLVFAVLSAAAIGEAVLTAGSANPNWSVVWIGLGAALAPIGISALTAWWDARERLE